MIKLLMPFFLLSSIYCSGQNIDSIRIVEQIDSLIKITQDHIKQENLEKASEMLVIAENIAIEQAGIESKIYGDICFVKGVLRREEGNSSEVEKWFLQAKEIWKKTKDKPDRAQATLLNNLFIINANRGNLDTATEYLMGARDIIEKLEGKDNITYCSIHSNVGMLYKSRGYLEKAITIFQEVKYIFEIKLENREHPSYINNLMQLGHGYRRFGQYEKAESIFFEGKQIIEEISGKEHSSYSQCLNNLAWVYEDMGNFEKAELYYLEAMEIGEKTMGKDNINFARLILNTQAVFYQNMGNFPKAEQLYLKIKTIYETKMEDLNNHLYSKILTNLGTLYLLTENYLKAEPLLLKARDISAKTIGKEHQGYCSNIINLGILYKKMKDYEQAEVFLVEAKGVFENQKDIKEYSSYANCLDHLAHLYWSLGDYKQSETLFLEAQTIRRNRQGVNHSAYAKTIGSLAQIYAATDQIPSATPLLLEANRIYKQNINNSVFHLSNIEMKSYMNTLREGMDWVTSANYYISSAEILKESFNNILFYKGLLLEKSIQMDRLVATATDSTQEKYLKWKGYQKQLANEYSKGNSERKNVAFLESSSNDLEKELSRLIGGFEQVRSKVHSETIQAKLKEGEVVLEFSHFHYRNPITPISDSIFYGVFILQHNEESPKFIHLFKETEIDNLKATRRLYSSNTQKNLQELIWQSLEKSLENTNTVYYSPSGLLHRINFGAIPINENQTISDRFELHNIGSSRQLVFPNEIQKIEITDAQIFGGIQYEADETKLAQTAPIDATDELPASRNLGDSFRSLRDSDWNYLEWTVQEAEDIQKILENSGAKVQVHRGLKASEEVFKQIGKNEPSPRILHLATHGYFFPDVDTTALSGFQNSKHPLIRSGIVLAGANAAWKGENIEGGEDGILTAYEIAQMDLSNTELVVLSACDTGLGDIEGNEGVYGLQRAFKLAGVKYVLMSLWSVSDKKTYDFMTTFYQEMLVEKSIPQAYQNTQNAMRKKYALPFNPRNWAGFVLVE